VLAVVVPKGRVVIVPTVGGIVVDAVVDDIARFHISKRQNERSDHNL